MYTSEFVFHLYLRPAYRLRIFQDLLLLCHPTYGETLPSFIISSDRFIWDISRLPAIGCQTCPDFSISPSSPYTKVWSLEPSRSLRCFTQTVHSRTYGGPVRTAQHWWQRPAPFSCRVPEVNAIGLLSSRSSETARTPCGTYLRTWKGAIISDHSRSIPGYCIRTCRLEK